MSKVGVRFYLFGVLLRDDIARLFLYKQQLYEVEYWADRCVADALVESRAYGCYT